jgi:sarcosine oxidase subunit gamma
MSETIATTTGLDPLATPGRVGRSAGAAGVTLSLVRGRACAVVIARKGQADALAAAVRAAFGLALPKTPTLVREGGVAFVGMGPGQWLTFRDGSDDGAAFESDLRAALADTASVSDQTDARVGVRAGGPRVREMLAKLLPIDLHPLVFPQGSAASSVMGHISVTVVLADSVPTFEILVSRSYADSLKRGIVAAGAEFGIDIL